MHLFIQIEGIFKLLYIDPDIMQTAAESSDDEEDENAQECSPLKKSVNQALVQEKDISGPTTVANRLKRQETAELVMYNEFKKNFAKEPILNQRYEDIFRNRKSSEVDRDSDSVAEFDPNKRREEEYSIAAPGEELSFLEKLGVDESVLIVIMFLSFGMFNQILAFLSM